MGQALEPLLSGKLEDVIEVPRGELLRLSFLLEDLAKSQEPFLPCGCSVRRPDLIAYARAAMQRRQARTQFFANAMLGEPAWDLLLVLYVADGTGEYLTMNAAGDRAGLASTSAKRWIEYLEKEHLVVRRPDERDGRRIVLTLSAKGQASLDAYFTAIVCAAGAS